MHSLKHSGLPGAVAVLLLSSLSAGAAAALALFLGSPRSCHRAKGKRGQAGGQLSHGKEWRTHSRSARSCHVPVVLLLDLGRLMGEHRGPFGLGIPWVKGRWREWELKCCRKPPLHPVTWDRQAQGLPHHFASAVLKNPPAPFCFSTKRAREAIIPPSLHWQPFCRVTAPFLLKKQIYFAEEQGMW